MTIQEIRIKGKAYPAALIMGQPVVTGGRWIRTAAVHEEQWREGQVVADPETFIAGLRKSGLKADLFTFTQKLPEIEPRYPYYFEWDNVAAVPITGYGEWWEKRVTQVTRKNVRRGQKRGVEARQVAFDDKLVAGIVDIHNDTVMKQGGPNSNYGKDFSQVKQEYGTFPDTSEFIGAYHNGELLGIIKLVYLGKTASIMQIVSKTKSYDKRPTNLLLAKAVEVCADKGMSYLIYGKYVYGNKTESSLMEFKRRNGFEQIDFPRYYVPLTLRGRLAIRLKLHRGLLGILPNGLIQTMLHVRSRYYEWRLGSGKDPQKPVRRDEDERGDGVAVG